MIFSEYHNYYSYWRLPYLNFSKVFSRSSFVIFFFYLCTNVMSVFAGINEWTSLLPDAKAPYCLVLDPEHIERVYYLGNFAQEPNMHFLPCRSEDEGAAWELIPNGLPDNFWADWLAGTEEEPFVMYLSGRVMGLNDHVFRVGIYESVDRGENWNEIFVAPAQWQGISGLTIHPDRSTFFAAARTDVGKILIRGTDAGRSWQQKYELPDNYSNEFKAVCNHTEPDIIYCVPPMLLKSIDRGENWFLLEKDLGGWENDLAVSDQNAGHVYVAFYSYFYGPGNAVIRSLDGGESWDFYGPDNIGYP